MDQEPKQQPTTIDQNALSRQLAVYGHEVQAKLMAMRVFIHGVTGLGIEVAKNLILAGPKQVTIYDTNMVGAEDLGRNFYVREEDIGKVTRAHASVKQLKQLNPNVSVKIANSHDIATIVSGHECVVVLDHFDRQYLVALNKACREKGVGFIYAGNLGLYGFTFVDFGQNHKVLDPTGEQEKTIHIAGITQQQQGVVYLHDQKKHGLSDGDTVVFRQVKGMEQLNGKQVQIKIRSPDSFSIGDTTKYGAYVSGGMATQVKVPVFQKYYSLQRSLSYPYAPGLKELPICNWQHFGYPEQLHVILNGLLDFWAKNQRLPQNLSKEDAKQLAVLCKQWKNGKVDEQGFQFKVEELQPKLINCVSLFCQTQISPICSFWGGIITQQIVKLTGKYSPLRQWLHQQFFQIIQPDHFAFRQQTPKLLFQNTRYADYDVLFGDEFVKRVAKSNTFLIGAGALGCEFIKMFALMGFSTEEKSKVVCTDDDNIEISNLNRQFLFRKHHVGRNKSEVACSIGHQINTQSNFETVKLKVGTDSQAYFDDQFWQKQDIIVNAVDNIKARQYIDDQCVWFDKPLFESGTLGTKCHSQIVIPNSTISYNDIRDPPEQQFAVCTLKLFPYQIQHTIQWAREYFQSVLALPSQDLKAFYENKQAFIDKTLKQNKKNPTIAKQKLQRMKRFHEINAGQSYQKCVETSVRIFQDAFQNQIAQLLHAYPAEYVNAKTGKPYWSGLKRLPKIISVDSDDKLHVQLIQASSNIIASAFNLPQQKDPQQIIQYIDGIQMQKFIPKRLKSESKKDADKDLQIEFSKQDQDKLNKLCEELLAIPTQKFTPPVPIVFEKDDPTNWHIQFMGGVSNLRARNYQIDQVDNFKVKLIAGKIIPAIATATALVVGAVGVEIIKYFLKPNLKQYKQGYFKNITVNLALPLFVFNDPSPAIVKMDKQFDVQMGGPVTVAPAKFTKWDKIPIKGPVTLQQLKTQFESKYGLEVNVITYRSTVILFKAFGPEAKASKQRLKMKIQEAIESITKKPILKGKKYLPIQIMNCTKNGVDCFVPEIKYQI